MNAETLKRGLVSGLIAGMIGGAALLTGLAQPTSGFFIVMGVAIGILSVFVDTVATPTGGPQSDVIFG